MSSFLIVVGIGIWNLNQTPTQKDTDVDGLQPYVHATAAKEESPTARINRSLGTLRHARAFHVDIARSEGGQSFNGKIDYMRPFRMSAEMRFDQEEPLKTVIVGKTVYIESGPESWQMSDQADLRQFGEAFFKEMSEGPVTIAEYGIIADVEPKISNNKKEGCTEYQFERSNPSGTVNFCIDQAENIRFIHVQEKSASTKMTFSRLNDFLIIERPALPLLERKIRLEQISDS